MGKAIHDAAEAFTFACAGKKVVSLGIFIDLDDHDIVTAASLPSWFEKTMEGEVDRTHLLPHLVAAEDLATGLSRTAQIIASRYEAIAKTITQSVEKHLGMERKPQRPRNRKKGGGKGSGRCPFGLHDRR